jgi:hypothetical protein
MNNALKEWLETSRKQNDHMEIGTLTEVTDSTDSYTEEAIAYIVPLTERSERGLYEIEVLWCSDKCIERTTAGYRTRRQKKDIIYITAGTRPQVGHSTIVTPFCAVGKGHVCIPYHNLWISYDPITKKKLPMFLGLSKKLDAFIAKELKG